MISSLPIRGVRMFTPALQCARLRTRVAPITTTLPLRIRLYSSAETPAPKPKSTDPAPTGEPETDSPKGKGRKKALSKKSSREAAAKKLLAKKPPKASPPQKPTTKADAKMRLAALRDELSKLELEAGEDASADTEQPDTSKESSSKAGASKLPAKKAPSSKGSKSKSKPSSVSSSSPEAGKKKYTAEDVQRMTQELVALQAKFRALANKSAIPGARNAKERRHLARHIANADDAERGPSGVSLSIKLAMESMWQHEDALRASGKWTSTMQEFDNLRTEAHALLRDSKPGPKGAVDPAAEAEMDKMTTKFADFAAAFGGSIHPFLPSTAPVNVAKDWSKPQLIGRPTIRQLLSSAKSGETPPPSKSGATPPAASPAIPPSRQAKPPPTISLDKGQNPKHLIQNKAFSIHYVNSQDIEMTAVEKPQPPVPHVQYGLDRVLFNPGVYQMQDTRTKVYNFDPYLSTIMPTSEFDFNALKRYITSSKDETLINLCASLGKKYTGSTSSMTSTLAHFHYLLSNWRQINVNSLSRGMQVDSVNFTRINRAPAATFLNYKNGTYAIDADKEFDTATMLSMLGKSMEKFLTLPREEFEKYHRERSHTLSESAREDPESFHYSTLGDFLMRSQLDAYDPRLPGTGMFDLKTRAVLAIRMDASNIEAGDGYEIRKRLGTYESFEREYYDMMRSAFLKYSLQVRMGRMDGIFVAYHNTKRIFGFQYIPLEEMDQALHNTDDKRLGDAEFKLSLTLLNKVLDKATQKFPDTSLRMHFETRPSDPPFMYIFAKPVTEEDVREVQEANKEAIEAFEREMMGLEPVPDTNPPPEDAKREEELDLVDEDAEDADALAVETDQDVWTDMISKVEEAMEDDALGIESVREAINNALEASGLLRHIPPEDARRYVDSLLAAITSQEVEGAADVAGEVASALEGDAAAAEVDVTEEAELEEDVVSEEDVAEEDESEVAATDEAELEEEVVSEEVTKETESEVVVAEETELKEDFLSEEQLIEEAESEVVATEEVEPEEDVVSEDKVAATEETEPKEDVVSEEVAEEAEPEVAAAEETKIEEDVLPEEERIEEAELEKTQFVEEHEVSVTESTIVETETVEEVITTETELPAPADEATSAEESVTESMETGLEETESTAAEVEETRTETETEDDVFADETEFLEETETEASEAEESTSSAGDAVSETASLQDLILQLARQAQAGPGRVETTDANADEDGHVTPRDSLRVRKFEKILAEILANHKEAAPSGQIESTEPEESDPEKLESALKMASAISDADDAKAAAQNAAKAEEAKEDPDEDKDVVGFVLTARNMVDGKYVVRVNEPRRWSVAYSIEELQPDKVQKLYQACKERRRVEMTKGSAEEKAKMREWNDGLLKKLQNMSTSGKQYRASQTKKAMGKPVHVVGMDGSLAWDEVFGEGGRAKYLNWKDDLGVEEVVEVEVVGEVGEVTGEVEEVVGDVEEVVGEVDGVKKD